jgi:hypothetical protein
MGARGGLPAVEWKPGLKFAAVCLGLALAAWLALLLVFTNLKLDVAPMAVHGIRLLLMVALFLLLYASWQRRLDAVGEALGLFGLFGLVLLGYADPAPPAWSVLPAFLLPWALLVVELPQRHRIVLLVVQWLASSMLLEVWTGEVATTLLFALALAHVGAVWATLPEGPVRKVPVAFGAIVVAMTLGASVWFLAAEPTGRRAAVVAVVVALIVGFVMLVKSGRLRSLRVPVLVRAT